MISGQAFERQHKAAAAGGLAGRWTAMAAAVLSRPSSRQGVAAAALSALAGALAAGGRTRDV